MNNVDELVVGEEREVTVQAMEGLQSFRSFDPTTKEVVTTGRISYRDYDKNRNLRVMTFHDQDGKSFSLGKASGRFQIRDHFSLAEPLLDLGFEPSDVRLARGGARIFLTLTHPDMIVDDPITWDHTLYPELGDDTMKFSIGLSADARAGKGFNYIAGFFRLICINGLIAKVLDMGNLFISHQHFSQLRVHEWGKSLIEEGQEDEIVFPKFPTLPVAALEWPRQFIRETVDSESENLDRYPEFVREPAQRLCGRLPQWTQEGIEAQLELIQDNSDTFNTLDLVNAMTNVANSNEGSGNRVIFGLDRWMSALISLVMIGAFKNDIHLL